MGRPQRQCSTELLPPMPGTAVDTGIGIAWPVSLAAGDSAAFSFQTEIVDTVPAGGFSFAGPAGSAVGGTVATISDPNQAHPERVFGDDQLGRRQFLGGHGRRRQRQLRGDREPQLPGRRNVPHQRDDHSCRHQPRQLYGQRLRHDHGPSVYRDHGRPDRQQQHEGRFRWIRQSRRPPQYDALRVRARLAL